MWLCQIPNARSARVRGAVHRLLIYRRIADASEDLSILSYNLRYFTSHDLPVDI